MQDLIVCRATKSSHPNKTSAASPKHRVLHTPPDRGDQRSGENHDEIRRMDTHICMCIHIFQHYGTTDMIVVFLCVSTCEIYDIYSEFVTSPAPWRVPRLTSQTNSSGGPSSAHSPAAPGTGANLEPCSHHETWLENT